MLVRTDAVLVVSMVAAAAVPCDALSVMMVVGSMSATLLSDVGLTVLAPW